MDAQPLSAQHQKCTKQMITFERHSFGWQKMFVHFHCEPQSTARIKKLDFSLV
jgi:hypothetical protein